MVYTDHTSLRYLYSMQDTSNMLTCWAVSLQAYSFSVKHRAGKLNVIPDILSRLLEFEWSERVYTPNTLTPICRNVADDQSLRRRAPQNPYSLEMDNTANLMPAMWGRDVFEDLVLPTCSPRRIQPNSEKPSVQNSNHTSNTSQTAPNPYLRGDSSRAPHTTSSMATCSANPTSWDN